MRRETAINETEIKFLQSQIAMSDEKAFRKLFDHFSEKLFCFAFSIVKTKDGAIEVVDEVFVKIWKQRVNVNEITHLKTYLYTAVKNTSLNYISRKANEQITESFDFIDIELQQEYCPQQQMVTADILKKIQDAVNELPPRCKIIFKLVREDGLKYKEVADILNVSVNTVDAQMVIAVKKISEKVKGYFDFFPGVAEKIKK
jgi:RNA polymerase sigma-70 factor (family 1)